MLKGENYFSSGLIEVGGSVRNPINYKMIAHGEGHSHQSAVPPLYIFFSNLNSL